MPSGTANSVASPSCSSEPIIAWAAPPTSSDDSGPASAIESVKKLAWTTASQPRYTM